MMFRPSRFSPGSRMPTRTGLPGFSRLPPTGYMRPPPPSKGPNDEQIMKRSIDLTFGLIVVILNIAEIILISRIKRKKKIYEICILSLSVTDLLFGISNSVVGAIYLSKNAQNDSILEITYTTYFYFVLNSILHLIWITFDRLWLVLKPLQHRAYVSRRRICIVLAATWITSTVIAASLYASDKVSDAFTKTHVSTTYINATATNTTNDFNISTTVTPAMFTLPEMSRKPWRKKPKLKAIRKIRREKTYQDTMQIVLSVFIIIADIVLISAYGMIIYLLNREKKVTTTSPTHYENRVSIICVFIVATFVIFTLPYALVRLITGNVPLWGNLILISNSGLNSIIYFFRGKCERYQEKRALKNAQINSTASTTPLSTPALLIKNTNRKETRKLSSSF